MKIMKEDETLVLKERARVGKLIKDIREKKGIKAKSLAEDVKIDKSNLSKIEKGKYSVGLDTLCRIATFLDKKIDIVEPKDMYYREKYIGQASNMHLKKMDALRKVPYFKRDDSFHGQYAPEHVMYKLETLMNEERTIEYEFLIEYKISDPSLGIYYGCKCIIHEDTDEAIKKIEEEWIGIKDKMCVVLNNTFIDKCFDMRFKPTDNANDKTFWPFWITLNEDEDIVEVGARALNIIRNIYMMELKLQSKSIVQKNEKKMEVRTAYTYEAYKNSMNLLSNISKAGKNEKTKEIFDYFIEKCVEQKYLSRNGYYECAFEIGNDNDTFFTFIIAEFFNFLRRYNYIVSNHDENDIKGKETIRWSCFTNIIINSNGLYSNDNFAKLYNQAKGNDKQIMYSENAKNFVERVLSKYGIK